MGNSATCEGIPQQIRCNPHGKSGKPVSGPTRPTRRCGPVGGNEIAVSGAVGGTNRTGGRSAGVCTAVGWVAVRFAVECTLKHDMITLYNMIM